MKDLNVRQESIKIIEENINSNLFNLAHSKFFQDTSPKARETKAKMKFWDFVKIKSAQQRKQSTKQRGNPQNGRRYLQMTPQMKDWYPRSIKIFSSSTSKEQIIKWAEDMNRHFSNEDIQMANRHMKKCSKAFVIREIQMKTTLRRNEA